MFFIIQKPFQIIKKQVSFVIPFLRIRQEIILIGCGTAEHYFTPGDKV